MAFFSPQATGICGATGFFSKNWYVARYHGKMVWRLHGMGQHCQQTAKFGLWNILPSWITKRLLCQEGHVLQPKGYSWQEDRWAKANVLSSNWSQFEQVGPQSFSQMDQTILRKQKDIQRAQHSLQALWMGGPSTRSASLVKPTSRVICSAKIKSFILPRSTRS